MRYWRLFSVSLLLSFTITGCHRRRVRALPPAQAQPPIVTTMPPVPPLTFPNVELPKPKPAIPVTQPAPSPPPQKKQVERVQRHRTKHKGTPENTVAGSSSAPGRVNSTETEEGDSTAEAAHPPSGTTPPGAQDTSGAKHAAPTTGAAVLGKLSADDATTNPRDNAQTQTLIQRTEDQLKKIPTSQQAKHKEAVAQVSSFLAQAKQAWAMNDLVGAQTLANKAKILLDEMLNNSLPVP